jgi:membrane-bound metal-dependent hydrolase YbcI (DUF457 family)
MADFKTHLTGGIISGAGFSVAGLFTNALTVSQAGAVFTVGAFAGLLPDLDSDTGKPLTFLFQLLSIIIPCVFFSTAAQFGGNSPEFLICYFILSYLFINYIVCSFIKKMTVHRGIMHSIPFAILCGGVGYLLFSNSGGQAAFITGAAAFFGCLLHLILDELNSFKFKYGFIPTLKKSSGTALKFKSSSFSTTLLIYTILIIVSIVSVIHP